MKISYSIMFFGLIGFSNIVSAQIVNIPDSVFKNYLTANASINTNMDDEIQVSEADAFTGTMNVSHMNIFDLTGIEAFISLTGLNCSNDSITSLDVSANTALTTLDCRWNSIINLNVSTNTALTVLFCSVNPLGNLDVSANTSLTNLHCTYNQLTSLDISSNTALTEFWCFENSLTSLDMRNGNNTNIISFEATNNPDLTCIAVDNASWSTTNWTLIDDTASFSESCSSAITEYTNNSVLSIYPNPTSGIFTIEIDSSKGIYQLQDMRGMVLLTGNVTATKFSLDISTLSKGIYFLSLLDGTHEAQRKIVKQ
ncbi:MAG: T9SS type A sorting domain-containing protein [Bacteroidia bacterium]